MLGGGEEKGTIYDPLVNSRDNPLIIAEYGGNNSFYFTFDGRRHRESSKINFLVHRTASRLEVGNVIGGSVIFGDSGYLVLCNNATGHRNETELAGLLDMPDNPNLIKPWYYGNGTYYYTLMDGGAGKFGRTISWAKGAHPELEIAVALELNGLLGTNGYLVIVKKSRKG